MPANVIDDHFLTLFDETSCAAQVSPHIILCGDFNAKIGHLSEATDAHFESLVACPDLIQQSSVSVVRSMMPVDVWSI